MGPNGTAVFYTSVNTCAIPGIAFHVSETPFSGATSPVTTHFDTVREHRAPPFHAVDCTVLAFLTAFNSSVFPAVSEPIFSAVNAHISPVYIYQLFSVIADHIAFTPLTHATVGYATTTTGTTVPDPVSLPRPCANPGPYILTLLTFCHASVSVCYGYQQPLKVNSQTPPRPFNLLIMEQMRREL